MALNSAIYDCTVMHYRFSPIRNRFVYTTYMLWLDLDELDALDTGMRWFSRNRFNLHQFRDRDHIDRGHSTVRANIDTVLREQGIVDRVAKVFLLTNPRVLGYAFNPVSFYFCFDGQSRPICAIAEVGNTFQEQKVFFLGDDVQKDGGFRLRTRKHFYVSPFVDLDAEFDFDLEVPGEALRIRIDDYKGEDRFFVSTLTGTRTPLTEGALVRRFLTVPFLTLKVITLIHWQALKLVVRKLPYHRKAEHPHLQKDAVAWNK